MEWMNYSSEGSQEMRTEESKETQQALASTKKELESLKWNVEGSEKDAQILMTELDHQITTNPKLKDSLNPKIKDLLTQGKIFEAFKVGFSVLWKSIFGEKEGEIWFPDFSDIDTWIQKLDQKSLLQLETLLAQCQKKLEDAWSIKHKIAYTKALSAIKDRIFAQKHPEMAKDEAFSKKIENEVEVWTVILLNKKDPWTWGKMLQNLDNEDIDMTHVIVVTSKWPPPLFSHATEHMVGDASRAGVENDVNLIDYIKDFPADYVFLKPWIKDKQEVLSKVEKLKNAKYSYTDAALAAAGMRTSSWKVESYNCGAYVAEVLGFWKNADEDLALPASWLSEKRLQPSYLFTQYP